MLPRHPGPSRAARGAAPAADASAPTPFPSPTTPTITTTPDWGGALPEPVLLAAAAGHLSLRDTAAAAAVCRRWHATLRSFRRYVTMLPPRPPPARATANATQPKLAARASAAAASPIAVAGSNPAAAVNPASALEHFPPHLFSRADTVCLLPLTPSRLGGAGGGSDDANGGDGTRSSAGGSGGQGPQGGAGQGGSGGQGPQGGARQGGSGGSGMAARVLGVADANTASGAADVRPYMAMFAAALAAHAQPSLTVLAATPETETAAAATHAACHLAAAEAAQRAAAAARRRANENGNLWAGGGGSAAAGEAVDPYLPYTSLSVPMLAFLNGLLSYLPPPPASPPGQHLTRLALRLAAMPPPAALAPLALLPSLRRLELAGGPGAVLLRAHLGALAALGGSSSGMRNGSSSRHGSGRGGGGLRELVLEGVWDMRRPAAQIGQQQQQQQVGMGFAAHGFPAADEDLEEDEDAGMAAAAAAQGGGGGGGGGGMPAVDGTYDDLGYLTEDGGFLWPALFGSLQELEVLRLRSRAPPAGGLAGHGDGGGFGRGPLVLDLDPLTRLRELSVLGTSEGWPAAGMGDPWIPAGFSRIGYKLDVQLWRVAPLLQGLTALEVDKSLSVGEWAGVRQLESLAAVGLRAEVAGHITPPTVLGRSVVVAYGVNGAAGGGREEVSFPLPVPSDYPFGGGGGDMGRSSAGIDGAGGGGGGLAPPLASAAPLDLFAAAAPPGAGGGGGGDVNWSSWQMRGRLSSLAALRVRLEPLRFLSEATSLTRLHLQWPGAPASRAPVLLLPAAAAAAGCYSPGRAAGSWSSAPPLFQAGSSPGAAAAAAGAGGWPAAAEPAVPVAAAAPADVKVANWSVYDAMAARRRYVGCLAALTELADVELDCPGGELVLDAGLLTALAPAWRRLKRLVWWGAVRDTHTADADACGAGAGSSSAFDAAAAGTASYGSVDHHSLASTLRLFSKLQELGLHSLDVRFSLPIFSAAGRSAGGAAAAAAAVSTNANGGRGPQPPLLLRLLPGRGLPPALEVLSLTSVAVVVGDTGGTGPARAPPPPAASLARAPSGGGTSSADLLLRIQQQQQQQAQQQLQQQRQKGALGRLHSLTLGAGCSWHSAAAAAAATAGFAAADGSGGGTAVSSLAATAAAAVAAAAGGDSCRPAPGDSGAVVCWLGRLGGVPMLTRLQLLAAPPLPLAALVAALAGGGGGGGGGSGGGVGRQLRSLAFAVSEAEVCARGGGGGGGWPLHRLAALLPRLEHMAVALSPAPATAAAAATAGPAAAAAAAAAHPEAAGPLEAAERAVAGTTGSERMEQEELLEVGPGAPLRRLVAALVAAAAPPPAGRGLLPALRRLWLGGVTSTAAAGPGGLTGEGAAHGLEEVFDGIEKLHCLSELHLAGPRRLLHAADAGPLERRLAAALPHTHVTVLTY